MKHSCSKVKILIYYTALVGCLITLKSCSVAPAQEFIDEFKQKYGSLDSVETLILADSLTSLPATDKWQYGAHYYDYRSGDLRSQSPVINSNGYLAAPNTVGLALTTYSAGKYNDMAGIRLKNPLPIFTTQNGKSIFIKFQAAISKGGSNTFNKVIITLNTKETATDFSAESGDAQVCQNENTGKGLAIVYENDNLNNKRYLRIEKLANSVQGFGIFVTNTCNSNPNITSKFYETIGKLGIDLDSSEYPFDSWRFVNLNPAPKLSNETATKFQYEYADSQFKTTETQFLQKELSSTELIDADLPILQTHIVEIKPDHSVLWTFRDTTYSLSANDFDANFEFSYVSIKIQEDSNTSSLKTKTGIKNLIITQK